MLHQSNAEYCRIALRFRIAICSSLTPSFKLDYSHLMDGSMSECQRRSHERLVDDEAAQGSKNAECSRANREGRD